MARVNRVAVGGIVYHVHNRSNGRETLFNTDEDYKQFEALLRDGVELLGMRLLAYCIMPNHWHLVLYPKYDTDLSEFMRWVTTTHVRQHRVKTDSVGGGHVYRGTYKSFPIQKDEHLLDVIRYVEQNPQREKLVKKAEAWSWSSLSKRVRNNKEDKKFLAPLPAKLQDDYSQSIKIMIPKPNLDTIENSVRRGTPYGSSTWVDTMVEKYGMENTVRGVGRPRRV